MEDEDAIDWAALSSSSRSSDDEGRKRRHSKQDGDSDFVADDDSASDWEEGQGSRKAKVTAPAFIHFVDYLKIFWPEQFDYDRQLIL